MSKARLSPGARADIDIIADYGIANFGARTTAMYVQGLYDLLAGLAAHPEIGTSARSRHPNMRRHPFRQHVIFYEPEPTGVIVFRIFPMARLRDLDKLPD